MKRIENLIRKVYLEMPLDIYKQWLKGYLATLSEKEVRRLKLNMPELTPIEC